MSADRLEAALARIAALSGRIQTAAPSLGSSPNGSTPGAEIAERLDALIAHLRQALDGNPT